MQTKSLNIEFLKIRDVKLPSKGHVTDAGIDFYLPNYEDKQFLSDLEKCNQVNTVTIKPINYYKNINSTHSIELQPQSSILIPSGIKVNLPQNYALVAFNKSGVSTKLNLSVGAQVIDCDYTGEIHIHLFNFSNRIVYIPFNVDTKLIQFLLIETPYINIVETNEEEYKLNVENKLRQEKGFGSNNTF